MAGTPNSCLNLILDERRSSDISELQSYLCDVAGEFDPVAPHALHVTMFFAGKHPSSLSGAELRAWHGAVALAVAADPALRGGVPLTLTSFELFPPGKNNLVVASFEAPRALHDLHARVMEASLKVGLGTSGSVRRALAATARERNEALWRPHMTLGKIKASRAEVDKVGRVLCEEAARWASQATRLGGAAAMNATMKTKATTKSTSANMDAHVNASLAAPQWRVRCRGVHLVGQPKQVWLDWHLTFPEASEYDDREATEGEATDRAAAAAAAAHEPWTAPVHEKEKETENEVSIAEDAAALPGGPLSIAPSLARQLSDEGRALLREGLGNAMNDVTGALRSHAKRTVTRTRLLEAMAHYASIGEEIHLERPLDCRKLVKHLVTDAVSEWEAEGGGPEEPCRVRELLRARARSVVVAFHRGRAGAS